MKITVGNKIYTLQFRHTIFDSYIPRTIWDRKSDELRYYEDNPYKGQTVAKLFPSADGDDLERWGYSYCNWGDSFVKAKGRTLALRRLLENSHFSKNERRNIWESYFKQTNGSKK